MLTAAHCDRLLPRGLKITQVRLGDWDTRTNPDCQEDVSGNEFCNHPYVEIPVEKVTVHEDYNPHKTAQYHDIALLKLQRNVTFSDFIRPICLPIDENVRNETLTGQDVEVAGFGRTENRRSSDVKLKVEVTINSQENCENFYKTVNVTISSKQVMNLKCL